MEESEHEQWQEVISRKDEQKVKDAAHVQLLSAENILGSTSKTIDVKDWVKVRVTMDFGAARNLMTEGMYPRVQLELKTAQMKFVAVNGEQIRDLGEKTIPCRTNEEIRRCMTFRSASVVKTSHIDAECRTIWNPCGAGWKESTHSKHTRWDSDQAGREPRGVRNVHVDSSR